MITRPLYLEKLESYIDKPFIKILVGIRRAGKSSILEQLSSLLKFRGITEDKIAYINFDSLSYTDIREKSQLVELEKKLLESGVRYFLFDEVQNIDHWDEAISALYAEKDVDIYLTGSNSKLLSTELSTFFTGRYVDIYVSTLNFQEYLEFKKAQGKELQDNLTEFKEYLNRGGFPSIAISDQTQSQDDEEVSDIYASIIYRDLVERKGIRNSELFGRVVRFIMDNIGNTFSAKSISDYLKNEHLPLSQETVYKYVSWLEESLLIRRVKRYDIRGKEHLKTDEKFYLSDISLLYAINGRSDSYLPGILENIVYHELVSKGYTVSIGRINDKEIDFIAEKSSQKMYLQVATKIADQKTEEREFSALEAIDDNYPKYVITLEENTLGPINRSGIREINIADFITSVI